MTGRLVVAGQTPGRQSQKIQLYQGEKLRLVAPWLVFAFALSLNFWSVWRSGFDGLYGQDPYSYFAHAVELYTRQSLFHHWQWETTARLLYWPFGYPGLLALVFYLTGPTPGAAQLSSLLCWAAVAGLVTAIGQNLLVNHNLTGPAAGLMVALSPLGRQAAISIMADAAALFWTSLGLWLALKIKPSGVVITAKLNYLYAAGAGMAMGLAGITRYAALTALPLLPLILARQAGGGRKRAFIMLGLAFGLAALVYLPQFIINQLYPDSFWTDSWLADWSPLNAFQTSFTTRDGFAAYGMPPLLFYLVYPLINLHFLTAGILLLCGAGLLTLWRVESRFVLFLLLLWWVLPVTAFSGIPYESERFSLTFLPPLALLAGSGADSLGRWFRLKPKQWKVAGAGLAGFSVVGLLLVSQHHLDGFMAVKANDLATARQVEEQLPAQATLITFDLSLTFDHYTRLKIRDLWFLDGPEINNLVNSQPAVYLLADPQKMANQWADNHVGKAYTLALTRKVGPPLAEFGNFWLWRLAR
ncbi:MAG TPA: hypothetical protein VH186_00030 [Chloroflexia bacterium]|nr:hypothetical protein [Chloroflexia bacterium]